MKGTSSNKCYVLPKELSNLFLNHMNVTCSMHVCFHRSTRFWDHIVMRSFTEDWIENFRVSRETFLYLCEQLKPVIQRQDTRFRKAICVQLRVAITLWCLATCGEYRTIGHLFGVARCTVCVIVHDTCAAIIKVLQSKYITFPTGNDLQCVVDGFNMKWDMVQCAGAIDGCHIPVKPPSLNHTDFYNRKGWYSIILQAVVDHEYLFRDVMVGWPGSVHDARVLVNSQLYHRIQNKELLTTSSRTLLGKDIRPFLVGDSAYPLSTWLMKPFPHNSALSDRQKTFNYRLSRARIVVENAFGRLKARWRRLTKQNDMEVSHVPQIVTACCILHNICEIHGNRFVDSWMDATTRLEQPTSTATPIVTSSQSKDIRDLLMQHLANN